MHEPLTPDHRCTSTPQALCWHIRGRLADGRTVAIWNHADNSGEPQAVLQRVYPGVLVLSVTLGINDPVTVDN